MDAIKLVKEAENRALELVNEAKASARKAIDEASVKAEESYKAIYNEAINEASRIEQKAEAEGKELSLPLINTGNEVSQRIAGLKDSDLKEAVNIIVERIVKKNGNS